MADELNPPEGAAGEMAIRLGIIGCGEVVAQGHAVALRATPDISVLGLSDPSPHRTEIVAQALGAETTPGYRDHRELLAEHELDAVLLATPSNVREEIIDELAAAGLFVLCEKPIALTLASADRIVARCESAGVGLGMCHSWAYFSEFVTVRQLIDDGAVGQVHTVVLQGLSANPWAGAATWRPGWRDDPSIAGGGRFLDTGLHTLYLMEMMFGAQATSVSADVCYDPGIDVESRCFSRFRFPSGIGVVDIGRGHGPAQAAVVGDKGRIQIQYPIEAGDLGALPERVVVIREGRVTDAVSVPPRGMFTPRFYQAVVAAISGGKTAALHSGRQGARALELVLAAYASAARQRPVSLPLASDDPVYQQGIAGL
jgi:predicted dehydrogenase